MKKTLTFLLLIFFVHCANAQSLRLGAERTEVYIPLLAGKSVGLIGNQSSLIGNTHLVDSLRSLNVNLSAIFSPEHGFRGDSEAGALIGNEKDAKTGISVVSLYGKNKKPQKAQLKDIDVMLFDLQDVGTRFYTYISTLHYVMEACAEQGIPLIVLDRPNPNGHYVDGPILEKKYTSFVGMHAIPVVHGMTIGEYAQMINGEKWLNNGIQCTLTVIEMSDYDRNLPYSLPVPPSPNLPTDKAIALYPSLCFFEGTNVSIGRGTEKPFEIYGSPDLPQELPYRFTPRIIKGKSENPPHKDKVCYGVDLSTRSYDSIRNEKRLNLSYLISAYNASSDKTKFFNDFLEKLTGTATLRQQIVSGLSEDEIRQSWQADLEQFLTLRKKYMLYD